MNLRLWGAGVEARFEVKREDLWVGAYWKDTTRVTDDGPRTIATDVWICLVPCVPLHLTIRWPGSVDFAGGGDAGAERARRYADHRATFPTATNDRRLELVTKRMSGFTEEERLRPFADYPGWKEECDRRRRANLTEAEHAELAACEGRLDEWDARSPRAAEREAEMAELEALQRRLERGAGGTS